MMNRFQMSDIDKTANIHFIGIGGISMSGLAQIVLKDGYGVSGSDWNKRAITEKLENMGADIVYGHGAVNEDGINKASLVVYTAAAKADNPEIVLAKEKGIRLIDRAEFLGAIMKNYKHAVGVSGTHGKTTTTSMLAHALIGANLDPTISVGGELDLIGGNIRTGKSDYFVTEACEYTNSFLKFYPTIALITNVEEDHLDFFSGIDEIIASFRQFAYLTKDIGYVVAMGGDKNVQKVLENADDHKYIQTVTSKHGIYFSKPGNGICHQVHLERFGKPGKTLIGSDSHTPTGGGIGMIAIGAGGQDVAVAMGGGAYYITYPKIVNVELVGKLSPWVSAKDVILKLLSVMTVKGGVGKIIEYTGEGVKTLSVPERATITNMGAERGATTSVFPSDETTREFLRAQGREDVYVPL